MAGRVTICNIGHLIQRARLQCMRITKQKSVSVFPCMNQSCKCCICLRRGSSFAEVASRLLQLGGGPGLILRLLLARATRDLGSEVCNNCFNAICSTAFHVP